ncbi:MAG: LysM domain-containing protein [Myxococcota bacterium]
MTRWLVLLTLFAAASPAGSRELVYRPEKGETLESLARRFYGDEDLAILLRVYNGLEPGQSSPSVELRIRVADRHRVTEGETWSGLADRYWSDASLHRSLAELVAGDPQAPPRKGETLVIPALAPYPLGPGETLAAVSRRIFGDSAHAELLARLNGVSDPRRLQVGTILHVPVWPPADAGKSPATLPDVAASPPQEAGTGRGTQAPSLSSQLRHAVNAYLDGSYQAALKKLEALRPTILEKGRRAEQTLLLRHLVFVYAAFDRREEACKSYGKLKEIDPELHWSRDEVSPKILGLLESCPTR